MYKHNTCMYRYLRCACIGLYTRATVIHDHSISQVSSHNKVVFYYKGSLLRMHDEPLYDLGRGDALLTVKVR